MSMDATQQQIAHVMLTTGTDEQKADVIDNQQDELQALRQRVAELEKVVESLKVTIALDGLHNEDKILAQQDTINKMCEALKVVSYELQQWNLTEGDPEAIEALKIAFHALSLQPSTAELAAHDEAIRVEEREAISHWKPTDRDILEFAEKEELFLFASEDDLLAIANGLMELIQLRIAEATRQRETNEKRQD